MAVQLFFCAILALTAWNVIFCDDVGLSQVLHATCRPRMLLSYAGLLNVFTLISAWMGIVLSQLVPGISPTTFYRPTTFVIRVAAVHPLATLLYRMFFAACYKRLESVFPSSVISCTTSATLFIQRMSRMTDQQVTGHATGAGAVFSTAVLISSHAVKRLRNPDMPKASQGSPSVFLCADIPPMTLFGFAGGKLF